MSTINFLDMTFSDISPKVKTITYNDYEIEVKQWLPIQDKYNIVMITLQQAKEGGTYNEIKLDMYFTLNLIYKYTNIIFTVEDRLNADATFDRLNTSGLMGAIMKAIPEDEVNQLSEYIEVMRERLLKYNTTIPSIIQSLIEIAPDQVENFKAMLDSFDKEKFKEVIEFAKAANGGRDISIGQK